MGTFGARIGPQFNYQLDDTIDGCLNCTVPPEMCTGGEYAKHPDCQFYVAPKPDGRCVTPDEQRRRRVRRLIAAWWRVTKQ